MRQARILTVNILALFQNRLMLWVVGGFLIMLAPLTLFATRIIPWTDQGMVWSLFLADLIFGYFAVFVQLNIHSRSFSFTLPRNSAVSGEVLILLGILLNSVGLLFFWPAKLTGSSGLHLLSVFMVGNFCFLIPAIACGILKSASMFVVYAIPILAMLPIYCQGLNSQTPLHSTTAILFGLLTWSFVWSRFRDKSFNRSLVGRTDFEIVDSWINQGKIGRVFAKTLNENRKEVRPTERFLERAFVHVTTSPQVSPDVKGLAGVVYSVLGGLNYQKGIAALAILVLLGSSFRLFLTDHTSRLYADQFALIVIVSLYSLIPPTALSQHFVQLPLSRKVKARIAIYWHLLRTAMAATAIFIGVAILALSLPDDFYLDLRGVPGLIALKVLVVVYAIPFLIVAESFLTNSAMAFLMLPLAVFWAFPILSLTQPPIYWGWLENQMIRDVAFWPNNQTLLFSSWGARFAFIVIIWSPLVIASIWRLRCFDLIGPKDFLPQVWRRRLVRKGITLGVCFSLAFFLGFSAWRRSTLDKRLIADDDQTKASAIQEFSTLLPQEKEMQIDRLIDVLRRGKNPKLNAAAFVLGKIGWRAQRALPVMTATLKVNDVNLQWNILDALSNWGPTANPAAPAVYALLKNANSNSRAMAASALVFMEVPDANRADILKELTAAVSYPNLTIARRAIAALGALGPGAKSAIPAVLNAAENKDLDKFPNSWHGWRRLSAIQALGQIGVKTPEVTAILRRDLHQLGSTAIEALISLEQTDPDTIKSAPEAVALLAKYIKGTNHALDTYLFESTDEGNYGRVKVLIDLGANIDAKGFYTGKTPLMIAAQEGNVNIVRLLLTKGADITIRSSAQGTDWAVKGPSWDGPLSATDLYDVTDRIGLRRFLPSYENKTALAYALESDLSPDTKGEIVNLLRNRVGNLSGSTSGSLK